MMKSAFRCVQIVLLFYGVFGADEDEVKAVSVMEGDSVTLHPDLTQIKTFYLIEWRFRDPIIAQTDRKDISYPSHTDIFRDRLQLDLTGSLTIKNMKTKHAGLYELKIRHSDGTTERKFNVTVYESASDPGESEMKSVSVMSGDRVTLQTGVTQISGDELIVWRFGDEGKVIAKADIEAKSSPLYYDERFRDRLELELDQTGSLTITNTRSTDSGFYSVKISSRTQTVHKRFTVTVIEPGLSSGAVAGIVLLVLVAVVAAAAVGFIYYRRKISELRKQIFERVYVTEGESVHLPTGRPKIERDDVIEWRFRDEIIAEVKEGTGKTHDGADGRFRDRLQLNDQTGDLTITSSTDEDAGDYQLKIRSRKGNKNRTYSVIIPDEVSRVSVTEGESVHLSTDRPKIERDDVIQWRFRDEIIAEVKGGTGETHDGADERFRARLQLDDQTGDLTIKNSTAKDAGYYNLKIRSSKGNTNKIYRVIIRVTVPVTVSEGEDVTLKPNKTIQKGDGMQWMFGEEEKQISLAKFIRETGEKCIYDYAAGGRFRGTLKLDTTGSLIIRNSRTTHSGLYTLYITSSSGDSQQRFFVTVKETLEEILVEEGDTVTLNLHTEIQGDDQIQWIFGNQYNLIAQIRGGTGEICIYNDVLDGRFRGRLKLEKTGSLTITNIKPEHTGLYKLQIITSRRTLCKRFRVYMRWSRVSVTEGESVHLPTGRPKIERGDVIQWRCGDEIIAEIKEGTGETHDGPDGRFRDRLQLDKRTGDLTIKTSTTKHEGRYKLKIRSSKGNTNKTYLVKITCKATGKPLMKGNNDESVVEMQPLMIK